MVVSAPGSDESLLAGLASGDAELEAAFVRRFQDRVFSLAYRLVGETGLAEDIAQDAFLRAWRHASDFNPKRASVTTWLLAITRNLAIDALRRRRALPVNPDSPVWREPASQAKPPDELAVDADAASRLREALRQLPPEQHRAVVRAFSYGQTAHEISMAEGIPLGTAKTRIRLGMAKLRAATNIHTVAA
jgi:RNA polymerase sigma-70 factor (ECF subfamily)